MPWQEYLQYIRDYADHFGVTKHIQFNTGVTKVTPAADYSSTGRSGLAWNLLRIASILTFLRTHE